MNKVAILYNKLKHASKNKGSLFAIHKKINYKDKSVNNLYDFILRKYDIKDNLDILDCGCGVGFGSLLLAKNTNNNITGISISPDEIKQANRNLAQSSKSNNVTFLCKSFDDLAPNSFDVVIAIESLKHSASLDKSLKSIKNTVRRGGQLIIIEDVANSNLKNGFASKRLKSDWVLSDLYSEEQYTKNDNFEWYIRDLTERIYLPSKISLCVKIIALELKSYLDKLLQRKNSAATIFRGGFYQDWLYLNKMLNYKVLHGIKINE